jgi:uncharacterized membrane protein YphA (DoxX/SURF4 family)
MSTVVWVVQGILATLFAIAGFMKMAAPKSVLEENMGWVKDYSKTMVKFIGTCELLGAIGLVAPMSFNVLPVLTPIAATCLAVVMILATRTHLKRKEYKEIGITLFLFIVAVFIAVNRF